MTKTKLFFFSVITTVITLLLNSAQNKFKFQIDPYCDACRIVTLLMIHSPSTHYVLTMKYFFFQKCFYYRK